MTEPVKNMAEMFKAGAVAGGVGTELISKDALARRGGDVTLVELPAIGIRGNTHFPMSDLNNVQIADLLSEFLRQKHLD